MTYRGYVENGVIQLSESVVLPEGAEVQVAVTSPQDPIVTQASTIEDELRAIWADVSEEEWRQLPSDLTDNLDHYIHGTAK
jgi:predicted DNA-binding antitoxin AbrB/MazE fold protein